MGLSMHNRVLCVIASDHSCRHFHPCFIIAESFVTYGVNMKNIVDNTAIVINIIAFIGEGCLLWDMRFLSKLLVKHRSPNFYLKINQKLEWVGVILFIILDQVRSGYIWYWLAPQGLGTAGISPAELELPEVRFILDLQVSNNFSFNAIYSANILK